jgi:hypothetical protein
MRALAFSFAHTALLAAALAACGESFSSPETSGGAGGDGAAGAGGNATGLGGVGPGGGGTGGTGGQVADDWCVAPAKLLSSTLCQLGDQIHWPEFPVITETNVYWSEASSIGWVPKNGAGGPQELTDAGASNECLVLDGAQLWWVDKGSESDPDNHPPTVWTIQTNGAGLAGHPLLTPGPRMLAVDQQGVYWTSWDATTAHGAVARMDRGGANQQVLLDLEVEPAGIAVDGTYLFWLDLQGVHRMTIGDMGSATLWSEIDSAGVSSDAMLLVGGDYLYWNEREGIARAPLAAQGGGRYPLCSGFDDTTGLFLRDGFAYFADYTAPDGVVARVDDEQGGFPTELATDLVAPRGAAADADAVYFATSPESEDVAIGTIMKARLPQP